MATLHSTRSEHRARSNSLGECDSGCTNGNLSPECLTFMYHQVVWLMGTETTQITTPFSTHIYSVKNSSIFLDCGVCISVSAGCSSNPTFAATTIEYPEYGTRAFVSLTLSPDVGLSKTVEPQRRPAQSSPRFGDSSASRYTGFVPPLVENSRPSRVAARTT